MSNISTPMEFKNYKVFRYTFAGRPLVIETGKMAGLANGSVLIRYGDTVLLCCATASAKPRDGIDFLPSPLTMTRECMQQERFPADTSRERVSPLKRQFSLHV